MKYHKHPNPNHYHVHRTPTPSQMNTIHDLTFCILNINFNIILSSTPRSKLCHHRFLSRISISLLTNQLIIRRYIM
jgi:hypothetical protein